MGRWPYPEGLYLVDRAGENLREVSMQTGVLSTRTLQWSPGGDHLAWLSQSPERAAYVLDLNAETVKRLRDADNLSGLTFSPDGRKLALVGAEGLILYDLAAGTAHKTAWTTEFDTARWSPTGERLLMERHIAGHRTHLVSALDAHTLDQTGHTAITFETATWAPDGERLAYISDGCTSEGFDIWTVQSLRERTRLTHTSALKTGVLWSPVDETIAFGSGDRLMLVDATTKEERTLAVRSSDVIAPLRPLAWSPDGRFLAFYTPDGRGVC